ncbi:MAG: hypothetical protein WC277_10820 [Bacilli bacterium]
MSDTLNDILIECARLRGCYPLMHRTLHEFDWFCSSTIWGCGPSVEHEIERGKGGYDHIQALKERRRIENGIRDRFEALKFAYDGQDLIRLAEAFLTHCREEYADEVDV